MLFFRSILSVALLTVPSQCASLPAQVPLSAVHSGGPASASASPLCLEDMVAALDAMQDEYFDNWLGTWPRAIDWTAAVLGTHLPASLKTVSKSQDFPHKAEHEREDLVNSYFSDLLAFYTGQEWLSLLFQAYDDILWVVLGWLEAVTFVQQHSALRHADDSRPWYGEKFIEAFAHRTRVFWEAAEAGWDEELCGGGMTWNPRLAPYKNAITNELWIAASASMYLHFPGDDIGSPLLDLEEGTLRESEHLESKDDPLYKPHDKKYLRAAIKGYDWLVASNMTNDQGLYVDGFHITGWSGGRHPSLGTKKCDIRDETVYTYNQGVLLTGLRGLWQGTGNESYLEDGHKLISNVIRATGWDISIRAPKNSYQWQGLGRLGVLEDHCDFNGDCSQDGQMFKGIFFLHFNAFCQALPTKKAETFGYKASKKLAASHEARCNQYTSWAKHNAKAAAQTRDDKGLFSMWWTEKLWETSDDDRDVPNPPLAGADVRNQGVPNDEIWRIEAEPEWLDSLWPTASRPSQGDETSKGRHGIRTAEIQSGGVSILRAAIEQGARARRSLGFEQQSTS